MGAWGVRVLENDYVLDELHKIADITVGIHDFAKDLLTKEYDYNASHRALLGVAIVDASINGVDYTLFSSNDTMYGYKDWFNSLVIYPLLNLVPLARQTIAKCIEAGVGGWAEDCQESRKQIYEIYRDRLSRVDMHGGEK